jgi:hypothetical protein
MNHNEFKKNIDKLFNAIIKLLTEVKNICNMNMNC